MAFGVGGYVGTPAPKPAQADTAKGSAARLALAGGQTGLAAPVVVLHRAKGTGRAVPCKPVPLQLRAPPIGASGFLILMFFCLLHHHFECPLLGVKRTLVGDAAMSAFDPKRTLRSGTVERYVRYNSRPNL